ncbi:hypothetical protein [Amycolatopsis anabasis]|uniref:hypothetical protein n=1 Tax=Amycolatopsis anabasis TaxID=1840409 RepID=UPI00131DCA3C|nr:hypothetical protein [Amycolatopsis anabasis]
MWIPIWRPRRARWRRVIVDKVSWLVCKGPSAGATVLAVAPYNTAVTPSCSMASLTP